MAVFSEESKLLIERWNTVEEIFEAEKQLRAELNSILLSIEPELVRQDWWQAGWKFKRYNTQIYISHNNWQAGSDYVVWIGVEDFTPGAVFGTETPPNLYVWVSDVLVSGERDSLSRMLIDKIRQKDAEPLGEMEDGKNGYVLGQPVQKYLPGELEHYGDAVKQQIMNFFVHYAKVVWKLDSEIRHHLKKK